MSSLPGPHHPEPRGSPRAPLQPRTQTLLIVLVSAATVYLITNHWLHILDSLPYLGAVLVMSLCMFGHGRHGGHGGSHQGHLGQDRGDGYGRPGAGGGAGDVH